MERKVDVAIIGAGSAGLTAASTVRRYTDNFVLIDGGELGSRLVEAERESAPLRWLIHRKEEDYLLCLRDDRGRTTPPQSAARAG